MEAMTANAIVDDIDRNSDERYRMPPVKVNPLFRLFTLESLHKNMVQRDASRERKRQQKLLEEQKKKAALLRRKKFLLKSTQHLFQPSGDAHPSLENQQRSLLQLPLTTLMVPTLVDPKSRLGTSDVDCLFHQRNLFQQNQQQLAEIGQKERDNKSESEDEGDQPNPLLEVGRSLPKRFGEFPAELFGKPVEELDDYYLDRNTFVVVARDKTIYRFSATRGLFLLSPFNPLRRCAIYILTHPVFSLLVMLVILVNCVFMAANQEIPSSEAVFTGIYTVESLVKIVARGFILAPFTYLRDAWNWLDFVVVSLAYITLAFPMGNLAALRTFRVLRALKTVAVVPGLKTIVGALMEAVRRLRDVIILTLFVLSIFALVGLQIYQGTLLNKCVLIPDWMLENQSDGVAPATDETPLATDDGYAQLQLTDHRHHHHRQDEQQQDIIRASVYQHVYDDRLPVGDYSFSASDFSATSTSPTATPRLSSTFDSGEEEDEEEDYSKTLVNSTDIHLLPSPRAGQTNFFQRLFHRISKPYEVGNSSHLTGHRTFLEHINNESNWLFLPNGNPKICGNGSGMGACPVNYWCLPSGQNPNFGYTNFDNFGFALLCAFRLMTQDCWEVLYQMVLTANGPYHIVFFIIVIFMGSFYLVNLILAIVAMSYDDCQKQEMLEEEEEEEEEDNDDGADENEDEEEDELMILRREMVLGCEVDPGVEAQSVTEKQDENPYQSVEDNYCLPLKTPERRHLVESPPSSIKTEYALKSEGSNLSGAQEDQGPGKVLSESCGQLEKRKNDSIVIEISDCSLRFVDDDDNATNLDSKSSSKCLESLRHQNSSSSSPPNHRHRRIMQDLNPQHLSHKYQQSLTTAREVHGRPLRISRTFGDSPKSSSLTMDQFSAKRGRTPSVHLQPPVHSQHRHSSWDGLPVIYHHHHPAGSQKRLVEKVKAAHRASLRRQSLRLRRASMEACLHKTLSSLSFQQNVDGMSSHKSVFEPTHFLWTGTKLQMDTRGSKKLEICPTLVQVNERRKDCEVEIGDDGCRTSDLPDDDGRPCIEYNDLRLLQSFLHDTKRGIPNKPQNLKKYLEEKCFHLLFGWQCCPAWQRFASWVELFIMDAFVDLFITLCIVINTVFMALDHEGMSYQLGQVLSIGNYVFTAIFTFEAALKVMALGLQQYLRDRWSCFDLVIVVLSLVELGLANVKGLSILRSFRLLRVFKLAKSWPTLNLLIGIIGRTMGALGNLCFVLAIIIFIFAVMGMQLFGEDYTAEFFGEVPRWNFCDFLHSFMIVFRVLCGEWIESMWNCIHCSGVVCIPFFLLTMIIGNLVVLNLFLALLLSSFGAESLQGGSNQDDGEVNKLQEAVDRLTRFCRFVKSHVLVCIYHRMKRGGRRKYVPVYRKIDLDGKIWFEDTTEEDFEDRITSLDLSRKNESSEDANIPMIKIVRDSCNGTTSQLLTGPEREFKSEEEKKSDFVVGTQQFNNNNNSDAWSIKFLKCEDKGLMTSNNDIEEEVERRSSRKSYKQLRQQSLSTSSGCNISTPSCADHEEETGRSESLADLGGTRMSIRPDNKFSLLSDSTPSSNFKGYETEATVETSGNDLTDGLSSSEEAVVAKNIIGRSAKEVDGNKINNTTNNNDNDNENGIRNSSSSSMSLSSDGALAFDSKNKPLTRQQQQKQLHFQQYLLNLEATEVEIEYITYPDDCCPLCLTKRCCCCCPKWWQTTSTRMDSSRIGTAFWKARTSCYTMVEHKIFETFIIVMIICSSLTLAAEDKNIHENPTLKRVLKLLDKSFSVIFVLEMVVKLMAYGFKKYFTDAWCWLDFIIVAISMVSLAAEGVGMGNIGAFRALRTLRALRPLRAVSRWEGMKVVVNALIQAIPAICNVLLVCLVFWLIFSIMGVNLFGGRFGRCVDDSGRVMNASLVANKTQCLDLGGWDSTDVDSLKMEANLYNLTWLIPKINFDHVPIAYLALFQIATFKGWTDIMNYAIDSKEPGLQPETEIRVYMYLYFVFFIVFGSFFTLNLFIGVIIDNFNMQKKKSGSQQLFMTEDQKKYYNAMKKLGSKQPQKPVPKPHFRCSLLLFHLVSNQKFDVAIMMAILINMFTMAVEHYEQSSDLSYILTKVNQVFIAVFTVECLMKLIALRHYYFKQPWNVFDFVVVVLSILAPATNEIIEKYFVSPTLLRVVRVFRVGRILRLVKSAKGIRTLLFSLAVSLPALVNIGLLLFLIMFIYAIFGMSFFMHVKHNAGIEELFNFETFFKSMTLLFQISTSAGWDSVLAGLMIEPPYCDPSPSGHKGLKTQPSGAGNNSWNNRTFELSTIPQNWFHATLNINPNDFSDDDDHPNGDCGHTGLAVLYLVSYLVVSYLVVINMYIAVILENFSQATDDIRQGLTQDDFDMYYEVWEKFDEKATQFIPLDMMGQFVDALEHPLRLPLPNKCKLVSLNIPICENDRVHCLDILDALTKNFLGTSGDMGGELAKLKASIGYKPVTTTLLRRREVYSATVIQRAWRAHRKKSK